ncbi:MAG: mono/diheme cytochrome c family protein, partial [Planctomycetota bacterium]
MLIPPSTRPPGTSTTPWGLAVPLLLTSLLGGLLGGLLAGPVAGASAPTEFAQDAEALEHFETFVRPIFIEHCVKCHGGDKAKGGLRLDTAEGIRSGAYDEPIAVAGDLDASTIIEAVRYDDPLFAMPPSGKLPDKAIRALERWVELGAVVPETVHVDAGDLLPW